MLQTFEAIYDPKHGLSFSETVNINEPVRVLVTIIEPIKLSNPSTRREAINAFVIPSKPTT
jgi:hypothetical protein